MEKLCKLYISLADNVAKVGGSVNFGDPAAPANLGMAAGPMILEIFKDLVADYGSTKVDRQLISGITDGLKSESNISKEWRPCTPHSVT